MPPAPGSSPPLIRPEFGPTLPELMQRWLGVPQRVTLIAVALVLALGGTAIALRLTAHAKVELVHRAKPAFTLLYSPDVLHRVSPRRGELARLDASRHGLQLSVTVRFLRLAPYSGVAAGVLPLYAEHRVTAMRRRLDGFELGDEGKARVHDVPGYQIGFLSGSSGPPIYGRDLLLVPDRAGARDGVLVSLRQRSTDGSLNSEDLRRIVVVKKAFRSLQFGSERT